MECFFQKGLAIKERLNKEHCKCPSIRSERWIKKESPSLSMGKCEQTDPSPHDRDGHAPFFLRSKVQFQRTNGLKPSLPPSAAVTPARETDHGLPGLAVKKRNGRKLGCGSLLFFESHIRATNAPASHLVNPKNPAILSRKKIETGARRRGRPTKIRADSSYSRGPLFISARP